MASHVFRTFYIRFSLQVVHPPIIEGMHGFGCAIDIVKFMTMKAAPAFMIESHGLRTVKILQVENGATQ